METSQYLLHDKAIPSFLRHRNSPELIVSDLFRFSRPFGSFLAHWGDLLTKAWEYDSAAVDRRKKMDSPNGPEVAFREMSPQRRGKRFRQDY
jgi:hypothetical protein